MGIMEKSMGVPEEGGKDEGAVLHGLRRVPQEARRARARQQRRLLRRAQELARAVLALLEAPVARRGADALDFPLIKS